MCTSPCVAPRRLLPWNRFALLLSEACNAKAQADDAPQSVPALLLVSPVVQEVLPLDSLRIIKTLQSQQFVLVSLMATRGVGAQCGVSLGPHKFFPSLCKRGRCATSVT